MGFKVHSEILTYSGRIDAIIEEKDHIIIIEFKQDKKRSIESMIDESFEQIENKEYDRSYKGKKIIKIAIVFRKEEVGCKIEKNY